MVQKGPGATMQKAQATGQPAMSYDKILQDPMKHVVTFIEKKIRNLDKRKAKLDGYRRMVEDGKPLDPDQTAAASKYDEVIGSLEFAKDLIKTFEATTNEVTKQQRKASRREQMAREEADNNRVCFVVRASRIMELLYENETFREDFLNGSNGACVVSKLELDQLVNFYELFIMKSYDSGANIIEDANSTGNHMYELAEGRSKDIVGTTYKDLHTLLGRIVDCKYFEDLRDPNLVFEVHPPPQEHEAASVSSESIGEDDVVETPKNDEADEDAQNANIGESEVLSPNSSDAISSPSGFSADTPLKTEEFLPSGNGVSHTDTWQSQHQSAVIQQKPDAGDYLTQNVSFQYAPDGPSDVTQRAYQAQTIQEVLAEVQGPCQFLQESIIDREIGASPIIPYSNMDVHQQSLPMTMPSHTRQMPPTLTGPSHLRASALESAFQNTQNISPIDPAMITTQGLPNVQQHLTTSSIDTTSHVNPPEHLSVEQPHETIQDSRDQDNNFRGQSYVPATTTSQQHVDYSIAHPRQQPDNLGLGQTTFGGQQQTSDPHLVYSEQNTAFPKEEIRAGSAGYSSAEVSHSITQGGGIQDLIQQHQLSSQSIQKADSPVPHIPLPNEQQSGYRGFQTTGTQSNESKNVPTQDVNSQEQHSRQGISKDQTPTDMRVKDVPEPARDVPNSQQHPDSSMMQQDDQNTGYSSRNSNQQQSGGSHPGRGRSGYSNSGGYRSGPMNQGGGNYHQQRYNNNYRSGGGRYNNNYDNMGRSGNYSGGGYQGNQSGNGYRSHQDQYSGYRRGSGGGMRSGRGGPGRGNPRGGGNYNRSRTFRPQSSNEQAA